MPAADFPARRFRHSLLLYHSYTIALPCNNKRQLFCRNGRLAVSILKLYTDMDMQMDILPESIKLHRV